MNSYPKLHEIIDLPRIDDDDKVPDGQSHVVYITNRDSSGGHEFIPIIIPGFQWDYMWWIYRLMSQPMHADSDFTFSRFLNEFLEDVYKTYVREKKHNRRNEDTEF